MKIAYLADDGSVYFKPEEAEQRDAYIKEVKAVVDPFRKTEIADGQFVQRSKLEVRYLEEEGLRILEKYHSNRTEIIENWKHNPRGFVGRLLDDSSIAVNSIYCLLISIDKKTVNGVNHFSHLKLIRKLTEFEMGTEEGLRGLMNEVESLAARIESGEIPKTAMPRFFYIGHKHLCGFTGTEWFKCSCGHKWSESESKVILDFRQNPNIQYPCPSCGKSEPIDKILWYHEYNPDSKWECRKCNHQWIAENGEICPSCQSNYKELCPTNPPN